MEHATDSTTLLVFLIGTLISAAFVVRNLMERWNLPAAVGYIGLGLALSLINNQWPLIGETGTTVIQVLGSIGIIALLFRVGLESNLAGLRRKLPQVMPMWLGDVVISGALAFGVAWFVLELELIATLFITVAATATSIGVTVPVWQDHGALESDNGERLLDIAELDDISGVALMALLLAMVPALSDGVAGPALLGLVATESALFVARLVGFALFCYAASRFLEHRFTRFWQHRLNPTDMTVLIAAVGLMIAAGAEALGLSMAIGALFAGFVFSHDRKNVEESHAYGALVDVFVPFFFIAIGFRFAPDSAAAAALLAAPLLAAMVVGKLIGPALPALPRAGLIGATLIGVSMVPRAEIALIVMDRGRASGYVPDTVFSAVLLVSLASCILAPPILHRLLQRWPQTAPKKNGKSG